MVGDFLEESLVQRYPRIPEHRLLRCLRVPENLRALDRPETSLNPLTGFLVGLGVRVSVGQVGDVAVGGGVYVSVGVGGEVSDAVGGRVWVGDCVEVASRVAVAVSGSSVSVRESTGVGVLAGGFS